MYIYKSPSSYIQGRKVIKNAGVHVAKLGKEVMTIADDIVLGIIKQPLKGSLGPHGLRVNFEEFQGECTQAEIDRLSKGSKDLGAEVIIGAGGGKALDTAKAMSSKLDISMVSLPTIASNDSPTSCISVIYSDNGEVEEILVNKSHPDLVLVDSEIIARAPTRFFIAGMGDALATKFEAIACYRSNGENILGGKPTQAALAIANRCYDNILKYGYAAKLAVEQGLLTEQVEIIIESNILLSGIGFENGGLALAHAIHNGLTHLVETHNALHGEKVAFGTIAQIITEGKETNEIKNFVKLCSLLNLPITLKELGVENANEAEFLEIGKLVCTNEKGKIKNEPVKVTPEIIKDSILLADEIGRKLEKDKLHLDQDTCGREVSK